MKLFDLKKFIIPKKIEALVKRMPKSLGSYGYDAWGYNPDIAKVWLVFLKAIYDYYFRVTSYGLKNIPQKGSALIIANHSGQLPFDGILTGVALATNPYGPRAPRTMVERFIPNVPYIYNMLISLGAIVGDPTNCVNMLKRNEVIIVFPEGVRGSGKPYKKKYQLQYMGNGFMRIAISSKCPIIPLGIVGCEETMPSLGSIDFLAKLFGLPYFPIALPVPLPAKVYLNFGKPMHFKGDIDNEPEMFENVEKVKEQIQKLIKKGLSQRHKEKIK